MSKQVPYSKDQSVPIVSQLNDDEDMESSYVENKDPDSTDSLESLVQAVDKHDTRIIESWKDELNNLLIFAGLFSVVVTGFTVGSLPTLQKDAADTSTQLLTRISLQLSSFTITPGFINSTVSDMPMMTTASFQPSPCAVTVNTLWIVSLALSLIAAFFAIAVQQWLRRMPLPSNLSAQQSIKLRHLRYDGLIFWQVPGIVSFLPLLLQAAVVLFLIGLLLLLHFVNPTVASAFTAVFGVSMTIFIIATLIPLIRPRCPYKSPIIPTTLLAIQWCTYPITFVAGLFAFIAVLIHNIIHVVVFSNDPPPLRGVLAVARQLLVYTRGFGAHMIVDVSVFWKRREYSMLQTPQDNSDAKALSSAFSALPRRSLEEVVRILQDLTLEMRTRVVLRWMAFDLGNCDYHIDLLYTAGPSHINPNALKRVDAQFSAKFRKLMLACLPKRPSLYRHPDIAAHNKEMGKARF
ncbi:hypothetical protein PHLCEN_2v1159 [Hermanssonia centrifuga]|uniref:DUF6535 domain-containing protein n=1 Tax=Hermanssonia centrifuga TaxID=98765 RepID=A0A2R6S404_9APHY|nr:hypothetical protein PHLCEN_2v1159 [Hermanssonia centrifuga]